jgi:uncharacterized protein (DUF433 family)
MDWRARIAIDPDVLGGKPVVNGTRIAVELVIDLLGRGYTTAQVLTQYDNLTTEDVQACQHWSHYAAGSRASGRHPRRTPPIMVPPRKHGPDWGARSQPLRQRRPSR